MDTTSALEGKVALVTGAARGIGAHTARALARHRVHLVLVDRDAEPLRELEAELGAETVVAAVADVCDLDAVERVVSAGVDRFGGIDLVLANAGMTSYGSVAQIDPATFARVIEVNLIGVFNTIRAVLPSVVERRGHILVVSSAAAFLPAPGMAAYDAIKAGNEHFVSALRLEVAPYGVEVGSAHMGWIDTPMIQDIRADLPVFSSMLAGLPAPLSKTLPVEVCADAFVSALATRKRRVYVPRWIATMRWLKPILSSRPAERVMLARYGSFLATMDHQVSELGRSTSARTAPTGSGSSAGGESRMDGTR
ncbi:short-chain dehydrogenase [Rhodococcus pyridinivorans KG-16]|uniref:Short-chain dehydrogenase n=1 Tax=Rhodococcus pyridinivorans KG-16 TaxID=1441730 RepID=A0A0V9UG55_9NOCA|nr:SDR family oxidoreductase [Rhodococcus pyridinivorans]KSZ56978.1 short-chain dehydrogenase [Rhodococcus pyridinivorans KG-16]